MKRTLLIILALVILLCTCYALADAPEMKEHENNDTRDNAEMLCLNAPTTGTLSYIDRKRDTDCYRLYIPTAGSITVKFDHDYFDSLSTYYRINVYSKNSDTVLWGFNIKGNNAGLVSYPFYLAQGEYDLILTSEYSDNSSYTLTVLYEPADDCEQENNNAPQNANELTPGKAMRGALTYDKDIDYYRFTLAKPGKLDFRFEHEYFDDGSTYYQVKIAPDGNDTLIKDLSYSGRENDDTTYPFYLDAGTYSIRVESYYHTLIPYAITLSYTAMNDIELENNNSFNTATFINVNTRIEGSFSVKNDQDFYVFTLDAPGCVEFEHQHEYFDDGSTYYVATLYDAPRNDSQLFTENFSGRNNDFLRYGVYLPAGTYYVQYKPYYHTVQPYAFKFIYTPMDNIEMERNDDYQSATEIEINKVYYGSIITKDDRDYYKFTLDETSEIVINFNFSYADDGSTYFKIALDTGANNKNTYYSASINLRNNAVETNPFYLPAGTYYFRVESYNFTARPYSILINASPASNVELEWNNAYDTATPMGIGQPMTGSLRYDKDIDYYELAVTKTSTVNLYFAHEYFDDGSTYFKIYLDAKPNNSQRLLSMSITGRESDALSRDSVTLEPGVYYISVESYNYTSMPYTVTVK